LFSPTAVCGQTFTEFALPNSDSAPHGITTGPSPGTAPFYICVGTDGNLWFTENGGSRIGRITPSGSITEFPLPPNSSPVDIAAGADGYQWLIENLTNRIGRISTSGAVTEFSVPTLNGGLWGITRGVDGNIWFAEISGNKIGSHILRTHRRIPPPD
jgi:virginiamycin B lyase